MPGDTREVGGEEQPSADPSRPGNIDGGPQILDKQTVGNYRQWPNGLCTYRISLYIVCGVRSRHPGQMKDI